MMPFLAQATLLKVVDKPKSWVAGDWITPSLSYEISPIGLAVSHFLALDLLWWYTVDVESEENSFQELVVPENCNYN
ncbi:MAG: hypothetical protein GDA56_18080 [Hormoscilla sp. GM7CHS1pb]|nr:hypothetical protein [Hormoscilla sp. GM7CHS1pb]